MRDYRDWWLNIAQQLANGHRAKLRHPEDSPYKSDSVLVYNTPLGYGAKCFRRGTKDWVPKTYVNLTEIEKSKEVSGGTDLPNDMLAYDPTSGSLVQQLANTYLLSRGMDPTAMAKWGLFVSPSRMRLIYPGYDTDGTFGYIGRDVTEKHRAKSINYKVKGKSLCNYLLRSQRSGDTILVEDVNSALKIFSAIRRYPQQLAKEVIALNGTSINNSLSLHVLDKDVKVWLDGDDAGKNASIKILKDLTPIASSVKIITGEGDPKDYSYTEIQKILTSESKTRKICIKDLV